ncbi:hypothetical protein TH53_01345 [Pedobacter lusitanus]|uniref:Nucleotide-diphospho-sugar transferase domain-containing protein n=1 Tax=Pedobacter lusitanus TaxID=1503925 RepID=A0A0D0GNI9_9SPHI|nr:hypothetical protein [Pedobacter lusitanus]KIO78767.1 hypothetical protein TH53_01345 [Pedobacter lusitanus]
MINKNLVFLSYGAESELRRAIFCILSFYAWSDTQDIENSRIVIYTDHPEFFQIYLKETNIEYVLMTPALMEEMLGGTGFNHRRKIACIDLTLKKYPEDDLLFIDSDTFFINDSAKLLNGLARDHAFMHMREYTFKEGLAIFTGFNQGKFPQAFIDYISGRDLMIGGRAERFTENDYGWNSGVLGLHRSFAEYMPDVFRLNDEFYRNSEWFISEQLAFSLILQRRTDLRPANEFILHYWGKRQKLMMDQFLIDLLNKYPALELKDKTLIRTYTKKWKFSVEVDVIQEKAAIALTFGSWVYGTRKSLQVMMKDPFNLNNYKELIAAAVQKR